MGFGITQVAITDRYAGRRVKARTKNTALALVLPSISRLSGGLHQSVRHTALSLSQRSLEISVIALRDKYTEVDLNSWCPLAPSIHRAVGPLPLGYSRGVRIALASEEHDIVHQQGIWQLLSNDVSNWGRRTDRPIVISPRGMLDPWALRNSAWKKRIAMALYERRNLHRAACIHALTTSEAASIRALGLSNPIAIVPNGVTLPAKTRDLPRPSFLDGDDRKVLLFLGRIHPKKGVHETLKAWATFLDGHPTARTKWTFVVAGWDDGGHLESVKALTTALGIEGNVLFPGALHGAEKVGALGNASAFVLASYSEGLPMAVLEAWAHQLPVFMTAACNLPEGFAADAAVEITTDPLIIARAFQYHLEDPNLPRKGVKGRALVETHFTWDLAADNLLSVYRWLIHGGSPPACVHFP